MLPCWRLYLASFATKHCGNWPHSPGAGLDANVVIDSLLTKILDGMAFQVCCWIVILGILKPSDTTMLTLAGGWKTPKELTFVVIVCLKHSRVKEEVIFGGPCWEQRFCEAMVCYMACQIEWMTIDLPRCSSTVSTKSSPSAWMPNHLT